MAGSLSPSSPEQLLDLAQDRLAVAMTALIGSDLAQLSAVQVSETLADLRDGELVVADDRKGRTDANAAARPIGSPHQPVDRFASSRAQGRCVKLPAPAPKEPIEVGHELVGLLTAALDEQGRELIGVAAGNPAADDGFFERLLDPLTAEHDEAERPEDALDELLRKP
jgi:hypothetical protein